MKKTKMQQDESPNARLLQTMSNVLLQTDLVQDVIDIIFNLADDYSWSHARASLDVETNEMMLTHTIDGRDFKRSFDLNYHIPKEIEDVSAKSLTLDYNFHRQAVDAYRAFGDDWQELKYNTITAERVMDLKTGKASQVQNTDQDYKDGWYGTDSWKILHYEYNPNNLLHWLFVIAKSCPIANWEFIQRVFHHGWLNNSPLSRTEQLHIALQILHFIIHSENVRNIFKNRRILFEVSWVVFIGIHFFANGDLFSSNDRPESEALVQNFVRKRVGL